METTTKKKKMRRRLMDRKWLITITISIVIYININLYIYTYIYYPRLTIHMREKKKPCAKSPLAI